MFDLAVRALLFGPGRGASPLVRSSSTKLLPGTVDSTTGGDVSRQNEYAFFLRICCFSIGVEVTLVLLLGCGARQKGSGKALRVSAFLSHSEPK